MSAGTRARSVERVPTTAVAAPASISGANKGTAARFARGDTSEMRPNTAAMIGSVGTVAAIVVARPSRIAFGTRPSLAESGSPRKSRPAVAPAESRKPTSPIAEASTASIRAIARASAFTVAARRPKATPAAATLAISAARNTLGASPTSTL